MEIERIDTRKLSKSACTSVTCAECNFYFNAYRGYVWVRKDGGRVCYDCAEKKYGVRKETFKWYLPRKDLKKIFSQHSKTIKCSVCEKIFITPQGKGYHWHLIVKDPPKHLQVAGKTEYEYDICYECAEAKVTYRQQYGFWLRGFVSEHFIPCEKCQDKLHKMMMTMTIAFYTQDCITIETVEENGKIVWQFLLRFLTCGGLSNKEVFRPCEKCQKKLQEFWENKELHIGSENKPPVELWRRMSQLIPELDDKEEQDPEQQLMDIALTRQKEERK